MAGEDEGVPDTPTLEDAFTRFFDAKESAAAVPASESPAKAGPATPAKDPEPEPEDKTAEAEQDEEVEPEAEEEEAEAKTDEAEEPEEEEEETEEEKEDFLTVTAEERAEIEKDPKLKKLHRLMQADYTRKTTGISERERAIESIEGAMRDPEKSADFLAGVYRRQPKIAANALTKIATGEHATDFLVAVGLNDPEQFEKAFDRVREIADSPEERARYDRAQSDRQREIDLESREERIRSQRTTADLDVLATRLDREADKFGFDDDEIKDVRDRFKDLVRGRIDRDSGSVKVTETEIKAMVKQERARLDALYEKAKARARTKVAQESQDATKRKAAAAKERHPAGPSPAPRKPVKDKVRFKPPEGKDGLDAYVEHRFGQ
jgi:hypothetical protein